MSSSSPAPQAAGEPNVFSGSGSVRWVLIHDRPFIRCPHPKGTVLCGLDPVSSLHGPKSAISRPTRGIPTTCARRPQHHGHITRPKHTIPQEPAVLPGHSGNFPLALIATSGLFFTTHSPHTPPSSPFSAGRAHLRDTPRAVFKASLPAAIHRDAHLFQDPVAGAHPTTSITILTG